MSDDPGQLNDIFSGLQKTDETSDPLIGFNRFGAPDPVCSRLVGVGRANRVQSKNRPSRAGWQWVTVLAAIIAAMSLFACDRSRTITASGDPPIIQSVSAAPLSIAVGESALITVVANDPNGGALTYEWDAGLGEIVGQGSEVYYTAQWCCVGRNSIIVRVINEGGGVAVDEVLVVSYAP